ncbi:hypothetical protein GCM10023194_05830 [Planotetraspora phitsanulokensis]|uniref:Spore-associated protein A n=1 Tax=Planotetraspora phitsanulokensis TaxID=575192 RepID=A0A8J3XFL9_9ACTN|nr:spore-associated protein A [Planotetraspora phitsanulokensis]GII39079.1 hypothetical protein Pph01_40820 [Planotetraspora phitsanulokensis]
MSNWMPFRRAVTGAAAALALSMTPALIATPASAATASCGSGYAFLDSYPIKGLDTNRTGGYVSLYYNSSTGKNCAIAKPISSWSGLVNHLDVQLTTNSYPGFVDDGLNANYHQWAGPIYIPARGECVDVGGYFDYGGERFAGHAYQVHCG